MLEVKESVDRSCLSCSSKSKTKEIKINRRSGIFANQNIISFNLCDKCLEQLAKEFSKYQEE